MTHLDIILLKYPGITRVSYWQTQYDGSPWPDPYDGLVWENTEIEKPNKMDLEQWAIELQSEYNRQQAQIANEPIYKQLDEIDLKSIRALRTNDTKRLAELETAAQSLRAQLIK